MTIPMGALGALSTESSGYLAAGTGVVILAAAVVIALIASSVYWYIFLYRAWDQALAFTNRTTPARAVGFLFIPLFNLYWTFVAYLHLAQAMNRRLSSGGAVSRYRVNEGLVIAACVLLISSVVLPIFTFVTGAAFIGCCLILAVQFRNAAVAIASVQSDW